MDQFPSNAKNQDAATSSQKKVEKVTVGEVSQRPRSLGRRLKESLIGSSGGSVMEYVVLEVVLPAAKDMFADAISQGVDRFIFGDSKSDRRRSGFRSGPRTYSQTNYTSYSNPGNNPIGRSTHRRDRPPLSRQARAAHEFDDIMLASRPEAELVLERLFDLLNEYEMASVADLYDLVGLSSDYTDHNWGWTDLRGASCRRVREGYILELPRPVHLNSE